MYSDGGKAQINIQGGDVPPSFYERAVLLFALFSLSQGFSLFLFRLAVMTSKAGKHITVCDLF